MQTTRIDTLKLGDAAIETLKAAFLYDDATLAEHCTRCSVVFANTATKV
jgi:hypothetical protein